MRRRGLLARRSPVLPALAIATALGGVLAVTGSTSAQPPPPTPPPPGIAGQWSITRTWYRRCPRCSFPVIRTTPWVITQTGQTVIVDRGLRGTISAGPGGEGRLQLEGTESGGAGPKRFWYSTLRVDASGNSFEGGFAGSETIPNPCDSNPPVVTCLVSAGWLRAYRLNPIATVAPPPGPATILPPAPRSTASPTPTVEPTVAPSATPPAPLYLPAARSH